MTTAKQVADWLDIHPNAIKLPVLTIAGMIADELGGKKLDWKKPVQYVLGLAGDERRAKAMPKYGRFFREPQYDLRVTNTSKINSQFVPEKYAESGDNYVLPKILFIDIETAPSLCFVFHMGKQSIGIDQMVTDRFVFAWAAKWLYSESIMSDVLTPQEAIDKNDSRIIKSIHDIIDEADIVVSQNGNSFDLPILRTRYIVNGLKPNNPFQTIDTLLIMRKELGNMSNKQGYVSKIFNICEKLHTDFNLWVRCFNGDKSALKYMSKYNQEDVLTLEELYIKIRPYIKSHPNLGLYMCTPDNIQSRCPNCGQILKPEMWQSQFYYTGVNKYSVFRCDCGYVGHSRFTALKKKERDVLVTTCAR